MSKNEMVEYWMKASLDDFDLSRSLFESKRYLYCLFFVHLSIEKLLKGLVVAQTNDPAPYEHNLVRLAEATGIEHTDEQLDLLTDITTFNIKGRYDDYKNQFSKIATREYTEKYLLQAEAFIVWIKGKFPKI